MIRTKAVPNLHPLDQREELRDRDRIHIMSARCVEVDTHEFRNFFPEEIVIIVGDEDRVVYDLTALCKRIDFRCFILATNGRRIETRLQSLLS